MKKLKGLDSFCAKIVSELEQVDHKVHLISKLQYLTGCRTCEALNVDRWKVTDSGFIELDPFKKNSCRIFYRADIASAVSELFRFAKWDGQIMSISKYDRYIKSVMPVYPIYVRDKKIVSYIFRHNYIKNLFFDMNSLKDIMEKMGYERESPAMSYISSYIYSK